MNPKFKIQNSKFSCLIIDDMHPSISTMLEEIGVTPNYRPDIQKEEFLSIVGDYDGLIVRSKFFITKEIIDKATNLKFIGRAGAGLDNLDVEELTKRKIILLNAPEGNRDAVAEHAIGMLLSLMNSVRKADQEVRAGKWDREGNRGYELMGKTVGIIGYGYMGNAMAKRLSGFGCQVLAYDKYKTNYGNDFAKAANMEEIQEKADVLSLHTPLTPETKFMVNEAYLSKFKKPVWFINTARGEIMAFNEIKKALDSGKFIGAALDVLENEKIAKLTSEQQEVFSYLTKSPKILFTPHVAGWTFESYQKINDTLVAKIKEILPTLS